MNAKFIWHASVNHLTGDPGILSDANEAFSALRSDIVSEKDRLGRDPKFPGCRLLAFILRSCSSLRLHIASRSFAYAVRPKSGPGPGKLALSPKCSLEKIKLVKRVELMPKG